MADNDCKLTFRFTVEGITDWLGRKDLQQEVTVTVNDYEGRLSDILTSGKITKVEVLGEKVVKQPTINLTLNTH